MKIVGYESIFSHTSLNYMILVNLVSNDTLDPIRTYDGNESMLMAIKPARGYMLVNHSDSRKYSY